jgi:hypothetical protein
VQEPAWLDVQVEQLGDALGAEEQLRLAAAESSESFARQCLQGIGLDEQAVTVMVDERGERSPGFSDQGTKLGSRLKRVIRRQQGAAL